MRLLSGALVIRIKYFKRRPNRPGGYYWYVRRTPEELIKHFDGKAWIQVSLGTNDEQEAIQNHAKTHNEIQRRIDDYRKADIAGVSTRADYSAAISFLQSLNLAPGEGSSGRYVGGPLDDPITEGEVSRDTFDSAMYAKYGYRYHAAKEGDGGDGLIIAALLTPVELSAFKLLHAKSAVPTVYLSDAKAIYLKNHLKGGLKKFQGPVNQAYDKAYSVIGDLPLPSIDRTKAQSIRDAMLNSGNKTTSVKRRIGVLCAMINAAIEEHALDYRNPFEKLPIAKLGTDKAEREDFTFEELLELAKACVELNDTPRHIVATLIDTGARLSEIVGLRRQDVHLENEPPYIVVREIKNTDRTVKTKYSERNVPLVGMALWAIREALRQTNGEWIFPRYVSAGVINGNSASAAINKWLKPLFEGNKPAHSLRHTMETRLRAIDCPENIMLTVGGWGDKTVARGYGKPHPVAVTVKYLQQVAISPPQV